MGENGFHRLSHGHLDLVLVADVNLYGTRMATASSDHRVKVWDRSEKTGQWIVIDVWPAHDAEVTDVKWTSPYVGEHLGSIGEDGRLRIWHEDVAEAANSGRRFKKVFEQTTATGVPYMCLDFKSIGSETHLAVITRDGYLSVCEPVDHDDLSAWRVMWSDYLCRTPSRAEETGFRLSWHHEKLPASGAVLAGLDRKSLSLAVAVGDVVKVFRTDKDRKFYTAAILEGAKSLVRDVSWADGSMRGFDLIAAASKDGFVRIYEVHTPGVSSLTASSDAKAFESDGKPTRTISARTVKSGIGAGLAGGARGKRDERTSVLGAIKQEPKLVAELATHGGAPWRVNWSSIGDLLVSTGDDGSVRMWKKAVDGKWMEAAIVDAISGDDNVKSLWPVDANGTKKHRKDLTPDEVKLVKATKEWTKYNNIQKWLGGEKLEETGQYKIELVMSCFDEEGMNLAPENDMTDMYDLDGFAPHAVVENWSLVAFDDKYADRAIGGQTAEQGTYVKIFRHLREAHGVPT
ncbi:hypothetical protein LTR27_012212 [Elasticomyces elasticus]|nr:hypothetical protein LTR27_012212 [Elasticomyces elasticus]